MLRVVRLHAPAWWPAFLFAAALLLSGCSLLPQKDAAESDATPGAVASAGGTAGTAFTVDVQAEPATVREFLERHLEIQRFRELDDLGAVEISRLMVAAEANARELLNTLGYFTPTLTLELRDLWDELQPAL